MGREGDKKIVCQEYTERTFDDRNVYKEILWMNHASL